MRYTRTIMMHNEKDYTIIHANVVTDTGRIVRDGAVVVRDGRIGRVCSSPAELAEAAGDGAGGGGWPVFDARGLFLGPGLVDMHIHGCGGFDTASPDRRANLEGMARFLAERGVTTFQPTCVADMDTFREILSALEGSRELAACCAGVYTEGPFVAMEKRGGLAAGTLRGFDPSYLAELLSLTWRGRPLIRTMTLAPELEGMDGVADALDAAGVTVAWGHSAAHADTLPRRSGAHLTHLFNAMNGIDHRRPGLAIVPFLKDFRDATFELIADGVHVAELTMEFVFNTLGTERLCLISDAMSAAGLGPGESVYLGRDVVSDGRCSRYKDDGVLVGSAMLVSDTARRLLLQGHTDLAGCFRIASRNPCRVLGLSDRGSVAVGRRADMVLVTADFTVTEVFCSEA